MRRPSLIFISAKQIDTIERPNREQLIMPTVKFIKTDGSEHELNVDNGSTLMEIGRDNNMGLEGTCGGSLSCATCHVYFSDADFARVGSPSDDEMDMLELAFGLTPTSRLGCQITIEDNLDGLTVKVPDDY